MLTLKKLLKPNSSQPIPIPEPPPPSRQELINQISDLDWEAREACIGFLQEQYPTIPRQQVETLITLIFENNFRACLPNHFGGDRNGTRTFGYPYIWLLNELEIGGIQYLFKNNIWQIHWDAGERYDGMLKGLKGETITYLVTSGPIGEEERRLWQEHGLIFFMYAGSRWDWSKYPFAEDVDLFCNTSFLSQSKAP